MRIYIGSILIFFFVFTFLIYAQTPKKSNLIKKAWVDINLNYLLVNDTSTVYYAPLNEEFHSRITDSTLALVRYWQYDAREPLREERYNFSILKLTLDSLVLKLISGDYRSAFGNNPDMIVFRDPSSMYDSTFTFEKMYFWRGGCLGRCPVLMLEIDSSGNILFEGDYNTEPYIGKFAGNLTKDDLAELNNLLRGSGIKMWPKEEPKFICDYSKYEFFFRIHGSDIHFKNCLLPHLGDPLVNFLETVYLRSSLTKASFHWTWE